MSKKTNENSVGVKEIERDGLSEKQTSKGVSPGKINKSEQLKLENQYLHSEVERLYTENRRLQALGGLKRHMT
ncbi:MAG: hypothetical protein EOM13_06140 [Clostridia bacterium]|nr:hypothetical protein [Clostridia bacterium]